MVKESFLAQFHGRLQNYTDTPNRQYKEYNVRKGLRNEDGAGVRIGLTRVADVMGCEGVDGGTKAIPGRLFYCGVDILDPIRGRKGSYFGYRETCFLLLFGYLPRKAELEKFYNVVRHCYTISDDFVEMDLLRFLGENLANRLQDMVLTLYNYDDNPDNTDVYQTLVEGANLLAKFPSITCYAYQSEVHYYGRESLFIHYVNPEYSIAESLLSLLRKDQKFTSKEANLLNTIFMFHADHDGGSNSTFTNVAITSTGTNIYSTVCGDIGSPKGPRHGGANTKVTEMMDVVLAEISGYDTDDKRARQSVEKLTVGEFYDRSGLVRGFDHAVYTVSDPHAEVLKAYCMGVVRKQKHTRELGFYIRSERIAKEVMEEVKGKAFPTNMGFYSGLAYDMLRIPRDLYTPLFVCSHVASWMAHNVENKSCGGHIMHSATKYVGDNMDYMPIPKRQDARHCHSGFLTYINM